jgi:hypothetical protein
MDLRPDLWYEIVKSYDGKSKDPIKGDDHGTYSQFSVVMLLFYLTFGKDYPYNIAIFFKEFRETWKKKWPRSSVLWNTSRIGTLLKKMAKDKLVIATPKEDGDGNYYEINPKIIETLITGGTYAKHDGSVIKISLDSIKYFLAKMEEYNSENSARDRIFKMGHFPDIVDYFTFMFFIKSEASNLELRVVLNDNPWNPDLSRLDCFFIKQISEYINEMKKLPSSHMIKIKNITYTCKLLGSGYKTMMIENQANVVEDRLLTD